MNAGLETEKQQVESSYEGAPFMPLSRRLRKNEMPLRTRGGGTESARQYFMAMYQLMQ